MEENNNNNTNNTNNNNNNEKQVLNTEVGCSAKQRKRRDLIDLNESPPSPDYSQTSADDCHVATRGDVTLQAETEVQQLVLNFSSPTPPDQGHGAEEEQDHVQNDANVVVKNAEILRARKEKMPMNFFEAVHTKEDSTTDGKETNVPTDDQVSDTHADDEATAIRGMMLLQYDDGGASGSCPQRKRKRGFSEYYKPPCPVTDVGQKIVIRVESDEDILDDGYCWRKYGCKEIKGNPNNPRGYYRCTTQGCNIKKQVERDAKDPKYVLVTYDGKHTHGPVIDKKRPTYSRNTTTTEVRRNASMPPPPSPPFALPMVHPLPPFHQYGYIPYGMNYRWPSTMMWTLLNMSGNTMMQPFLNMVGNTMMQPYRPISEQNFLERRASTPIDTNQVGPNINGSVPLHVFPISPPLPPFPMTTTQVGHNINGSVPLPVFSISPPLPPFHIVPYGGDFLQVGGNGIVAAPVFPFMGTSPADRVATNVGPNINGSISLPVFPISPPLPPFHIVPYGGDFLQVGGNGIVAAPVFPFMGTSPADREATDVPDSE